MNKNLNSLQILVIIILFLKIGLFKCIPLNSIDASWNNEYQIEAYKILAGETLRLECPQSNPTWFYRNPETNIEDLIVTRHGIINVEYKHKITSHATLKHKIIFINKVNVEDDGIYSCLYTKNMLTSNDNADDGMTSLQQRFTFNVTVYSKYSITCKIF